MFESNLLFWRRTKPQFRRPCPLSTGLELFTTSAVTVIHAHRLALCFCKFDINNACARSFDTPPAREVLRADEFGKLRSMPTLRKVRGV